MDLEFITRAMVDGDRNFVFNSYLKSFRRDSTKRLVPASLYFPQQEQTLRFLLGVARTTVACWPEEPSEILGYAIHQELPEADVLHYLYVRKPSQGVRSGLVDAVANRAPMIVVTHLFRHYRWLVEKVAPRHVVYDPDLLEKAGR